MGTTDEMRAWIVKNKLKAVFGFWAVGLTGSLAYQWTRPIPTQLKVIHSRVYAQALTLAGLGMAGLVSWMEEERQGQGQHSVSSAPKATGM